MLRMTLSMLAVDGYAKGKGIGIGHWRWAWLLIFIVIGCPAA